MKRATRKPVPASVTLQNAGTDPKCSICCGTNSGSLDEYSGLVGREGDFDRTDSEFRGIVPVIEVETSDMLAIVETINYEFPGFVRGDFYYAVLRPVVETRVVFPNRYLDFWSLAVSPENHSAAEDPAFLIQADFEKSALAGFDLDFIVRSIAPPFISHGSFSLGIKPWFLA